jgi:oleate hydratase
MPDNQTDTDRLVYLVGGGIASLAAAAFLIRDGDIPGHNITIIEESAKIGGSLDAAGTADDGYVMRGGRMLESKYLCTYDLFSSIPTLDKRMTVTQEIFAWNETLKTSSKSRLFRGGHRVDAPSYGLSEKHILTMERLGLEPEAMLGRSSISDHFHPSFFATDFWLMWCTTFAFQPWHSAVEFKRYLVRFTHMVSGFNTLSGIMRTVYNQYDSMVRPLQKWLQEHGVQFKLNTRVAALDLHHEADGYTVRGIHCEKNERGEDIKVNAGDKVFVTLGSMTEASSLGSMDAAAPLRGQPDGGSWALWEAISAFQPQFGRPANFTGHIAESRWVSFTTTLRDPTFFHRVRDLTGNVPGEGGLITFPESRWLASIVLPHQPHFIGQPAEVDVFWGYGLFVDKSGDFVKKPMAVMHRPGDYDRDHGPPADGNRGRQDTGNLHLYPLHDAVYHQSVSMPGEGRSSTGGPQRLEKPRLHGPILRTAGRRRLHCGIFDSFCANRRLLIALAEPHTAPCVQRRTRSTRSAKGVPDAT